MKHVLFVIAVLSLLFGCAAQQEPAVRIITQRVEVPVKVSCIKTSELPKRADYVTVSVQKNDSRVAKTKKLIVHYKQSEAYIQTRETVLKGCSE